MDSIIKQHLFKHHKSRLGSCLRRIKNVWPKTKDINMTDEEYKERRQALGLAIAALDKTPRRPRITNGELIEIDYDWHKNVSA